MNLTGSARNGANATSSFKRRRRPQRHQRCNWTFGGKRKNDRLLSRCSRSVVSSGRLQRRGGAVWAMCETPQADPRQEAPETVAERKRMTPLEMITQIQQQEAEIKGLGLRSECVAPSLLNTNPCRYVMFAMPLMSRSQRILTTIKSSWRSFLKKCIGIVSTGTSTNADNA